MGRRDDIWIRNHPDVIQIHFCASRVDQGLFYGEFKHITPAKRLFYPNGQRVTGSVFINGIFLAGKQYIPCEERLLIETCLDQNHLVEGG